MKGPPQGFWKGRTMNARMMALAGLAAMLLAAGGALGDVMINLLGSEDTLVATIEHPDRMRKLRDRMLIWVKEMIDELGEEKWASVQPLARLR